ncbi:MAG: hypothetical protein O2788_01475 [Chloroflexi bacterium]|nr:hypothetical protein [Chloroflexota bacterium]
MTLEMLIIGLIRIAGSLPVLRWAFAGALIAILVDFSDLFLKGWIDLGGIGDYQTFDKLLDVVYMVTFLVVALRWQGPVRTIAVALFVFRIIGVIAFEVVESRLVLLAFPNVFEFWFVGISAQKHWWPNFPMTRRNLTALFLAAFALKMGQEWIVHGGQYLDRWVATELAADFWRWLTGGF